MTHLHVLNYKEPEPCLSKLAVASFAASIIVIPGFFLVFPPLFVWMLALGVSTELDIRTDVTGQRLARIAVHLSGWSATLGILLFLAAAVHSVL